MQSWFPHRLSKVFATICPRYFFAVRYLFTRVSRPRPKRGSPSAVVFPCHTRQPVEIIGVDNAMISSSGVFTPQPFLRGIFLLGARGTGQSNPVPLTASRLASGSLHDLRRRSLGERNTSHTHSQLEADLIGIKSSILGNLHRGVTADTDDDARAVGHHHRLGR